MISSDRFYWECIRPWAFYECNLSSVFVPPICRELRRNAFASNENLSILHVPQDTELDVDCIVGTMLAEFARSKINPTT